MSRVLQTPAHRVASPATSSAPAVERKTLAPRETAIHLTLQFDHLPEMVELSATVTALKEEAYSTPAMEEYRKRDEEYCNKALAIAMTDPYVKRLVGEYDNAEAFVYFKFGQTKVAVRKKPAKKAGHRVGSAE
jgi:hypothetical protein